MVVASLQTHLESLPQGLRQELPDPWIPWGISERVFKALEPADAEGLYKRACVLPTDPEGMFILRHFAHDRPTKWSIRKVHCIHSRVLTNAFETQLRQMEHEVGKFPPTWKAEPQADQRAAAIERWKKASGPFSPFQVMESDGRRVQLEKSRVLPLWHGTRKELCESVAQTGFTYFGKVALDGSATGSTDEGYFGSGMYFTNSARYSADIYSSGHLLLSWVSMREPFPVVHDGAVPLCSDMQTLRGKGAYKDYNAHYVPVTANPPVPSNPYYYPCKVGEAPLCDEVVVFQKNQALPRFWIELQPDHPALLTPSGPPQFVSELMPPLFRLLERPDVHRDLKLRKIFCEILARLLQSVPEDDLDDSTLALAEQLPQLIDSAGQIDKMARTTFIQTFSGAFPTTPVLPPTASTGKVDKGSGKTLSGALPTTPAVPKAPLAAIPSCAFGKALWETYFGDVGVEPPLPSNIEAILQGPCPLVPGQTVQDTHMLVLVPQTVNGAPFTLNMLGDLVKAPKGGGTPTQINVKNSRKDVLDANGPQPAPASHWVLMTKQVVPRSTEKAYVDQCKLVAGVGFSYEVPLLLDAGTCVLLEKVKTGSFWNVGHAWLRVRGIGGSSLVFAMNPESGLSVVNYIVGSGHYVHGYLGIAAFRKF